VISYFFVLKSQWQETDLVKSFVDFQTRNSIRIFSDLALHLSFGEAKVLQVQNT